MKLSEVMRAASALNFQQLVKLDAWLHSLMETTERAGGRKPTEHTVGHKTYRRELVRCGKKGCKCADGHPHGPYWYVYWTEDGKTKSRYVSKQLPTGVKPARDTKASGVR